MQIFHKQISRLKTDKKLFQYLANKLYKFFNVIERNDLVLVPVNKNKVYRVLDVYDDGCLDILCDDDPSPIRARISRYGVRLHSKFFKGIEHYRSAKHDNGWRLFSGPHGIGLYNFKNKEILKREAK